MHFTNVCPCLPPGWSSLRPRRLIIKGQIKGHGEDKVDPTACNITTGKKRFLIQNISLLSLRTYEVRNEIPHSLKNLGRRGFQRYNKHSPPPFSAKIAVDGGENTCGRPRDFRFLMQFCSRTVVTF